MRTEDGYIVRRCLNDEPEAFGLLVDKYKASIYAFVYVKLRNFHDAEDVTQDIFIKAYQKLRHLRQYDSFLAWLYSIASDLCRKWIRARSNRPDSEFIEDQSPEVREGASIDSHRENMVYESLHEALDSLPETYQQVLTLYYLGGMNSREIARFLGTSPPAIRQRLSRARAQLKEEVLAMMSVTFEQQRLQASFTFRVVEAVRRIKIQPIPRSTALPWGLSMTAGFLIAIMSLSPYLSILNPTAVPAGLPLPAEMRVLEAGEIPVDILEVSQMPALASKQGDDDGVPEPPQPALMAAHGEADTWTTKAGMPTERWGAATCAVDGKIYAIGGGKSPYGKYLSTVEEYDPATDTWTTKADMPTERAFGAASVVSGKIYVIGGSPRADTSTTTVEEYDPATDTWTKKADMPTARSMATASVVDGKIYAIGGAATGISTVEEYDPATDTWTKKASMPTARSMAGASVVDEKIYVIGGVIGDISGAGISTVEEYDPATDTWRAKADMPTPRKALSTSVVNGKIYAIGGATGMTTVFSAVEVYDPATDTWTKKPNMPTARCLHSTSAVNGRIYAIGGDVVGWPWTPTAALEVYNTGFIPLGEVSSVEPKAKLLTKWGNIKSD